MRVAFLCKRRYMGKDVIVDRYARLYEIPRQLARLGHEVHGYCLSYQGHPAGRWEHDAAPGLLVWESQSQGRLLLPSLAAYPRHLLRRLLEFSPDIVIGASDIPHVVMGSYAAKRFGVPFVADLYDNFESFGQARIPGFVAGFKRAVRNADLVTTTSEPLRERVVKTYGARGTVATMPSTVDASLFHPADRAESRRALDLPRDATLIGTAGGLLQSRGVGTLYRAWRSLAAECEHLHLVLAGPIDERCPPPRGVRTHYLGVLSHAHTATLFCALNVGIIYLRDTPFGRYCFPQKAYEMLACATPIVAAAVGVMPHLLAATPDSLYRPDDAKDLVRAVQARLQHPAVPAVSIEDWASIIAKLEPRLQQLAMTGPRALHTSARRD